MGLVLGPGLILMAVSTPRPVEVAWFFVASGFISALIGYIVYTVKLVDTTEPGGICVDFDNPACTDYIVSSTESYSIAAVVLATISAFFALVSIVTYLLRCFIYPALLRYHRLSPTFVRYFLSVEALPAGGLPGTFSCKYRLPFPVSFSRAKHIFRLRGSVNTKRFA